MEAKGAAEALKLSKLEAKWSEPLIEAGYTVVPNVIFQRQRALGLSPLDINILSARPLFSSALRSSMRAGRGFCSSRRRHSSSR